MRRPARAALRLLSSWRQSALLVAGLILGLAVVWALSTRSAQLHVPSRRPTATAVASPPAEKHPSSRVPPRRVLAAARRAAAGFIESYLRFAYGRAPAGSVAPVSPVVRRGLTRGAATVTPVERRRHPRVVSLRVLVDSADLAHATALVDDGGVASYVIGLALRLERSGWVVSAVGG